MIRSQLIPALSVSILLASACAAHAGWPFARSAFQRHVHRESPAPRVIELPASTVVPAPGQHPTWGHFAAPRPYAWGDFGARTHPRFTWHSGYYGDVSHWWE